MVVLRNINHSNGIESGQRDCFGRNGNEGKGLSKYLQIWVKWGDRLSWPQEMMVSGKGSVQGTSGSELVVCRQPVWLKQNMRREGDRKWGKRDPKGIKWNGRHLEGLGGRGSRCNLRYKRISASPCEKERQHFHQVEAERPGWSVAEVLVRGDVALALSPEWF